jgi:hypothetical protein
MGLARSPDQADQLTNRERLLLLIAAIPIALLSLGALLFPDAFAALIGAAGAEPYIYRLVGAAALGYATALAWALRGNDWVRVRLLVAALCGFSVTGALGALLQLLIGDSKGIVYLILVLGLAVGALTAYLLYAHRAAPRPAANIQNWLVWFVVVATLLAVPFALAPLFFPEGFAHLFGLRATDLLLYRLGGAELAGYVVLGALEFQSRNVSELHSAAIMVLFFNGMAVLASLLALITGEQSALTYIVVVVSGVIAVLTFLQLERRTGGNLFRDDEISTAQPAG